MGSGKGRGGWSVPAGFSSATLRFGLREGEVLAPVQHLLILLKYTAVRNWQKKMWEWRLNKNQTIVTVLKRKLDDFKTCIVAF